jgi:subtilisin family serine protease
MRWRPRFFAAVFGVVVLTLAVGAPTPALASDDSFFDQQWPLAQIKAPDAWPVSTGAGVNIGIVDTGVDLSHPDLAGKVVVSANCIGGQCRDGGAGDGHGHGTILAGIAAAVTNNGRGIAGVAPDARLVIAKAVDDQGRGDAADITNAIHWVVDHGARIVNLSLGDPNFLVTSLLGTPLRPGIEYAWSKGAIPVLASGNENLGLLDLGSSNYGTLNAVIVGATDKGGGIASYSSPIGNAKWGLVAPGGSGDGPGADVLSTFTNGRYAWVAGTSMAAPHVSGALALLLAQGLSPTTAVQRLLSTLDRSVKCGAGCQGRLDVAAAVGQGPRGAPATTVATAAPSAPAATIAPAPSTSTTSREGPTSTAAVDTTLAPGPGDSDGRERAAAPAVVATGAGRGFGNGPARNSAVLALAVALVGGVGSAAGIVVWDRLRAGPL